MCVRQFFYIQYIIHKSTITNITTYLFEKKFQNNIQWDELDLRTVLCYRQPTATKKSKINPHKKIHKKKNKQVKFSMCE